MKHLLVTNDFPPKIGGIQSLLWEWWRRLPSDRFAVLTSPYRGAETFDAAQPFQIERVPEPVLLPHPIMVPDTIAMRVSSGRFKRRATMSGPPTIAVNITSTCWIPNSAVLTGPG